MKKKPFPPMAIAALVLGLLAVGLIYQMVSSRDAQHKADMDALTAQMEAMKNKKPDAAVAIPEAKIANTRPVAFARIHINAGQQIMADYLEDKATPDNLLPNGLDIAKAQEKYALRNIEPGDAITTFAVADQFLSLSYKLTPGYRALALPVYNEADTNATGGFAVDGDRVDVLFTYEDPPKSGNVRTITAVQNIRVLYAPGGPRSDQTQGVNPSPAPGQPVAVTLEVTPSQAEGLVQLSTTGKMRLVLRNQYDRLVTKSNGFNLVEFLDDPMRVQARSVASETGAATAKAIAEELQAQEILRKRQAAQGGKVISPTPEPPPASN